MRLKSLVLAILTLFSISAFAQVDNIKGASKGSGGSRSEGSSGGGSFFFDFMFYVLVDGMIDAQRSKLDRRHDVPGMVSLDVMLQTGIQPSNYYIVNPRIRANWGLFSTDYRINYLIEEDIDGAKHIRTNEWQVIQLNLITTKDVLFRIGGGVLQEAYEEKNAYGEWSMALQVHPQQRKIGGFLEYRDSDARTEISGYARYHLFDKGTLHGFLTAGAVYQRYYQSVNVWGMQAGCIFSLY